MPSDLPFSGVPFGPQYFSPSPSAQLMAEVYLEKSRRDPTLTTDLVHIQSAGSSVWRLLRVDIAILSKADTDQRARVAVTPATQFLQELPKDVNAVYSDMQIAQLAGLAWIAIYTPGDDCAKLIPPTWVILRSVLMQERLGIDAPSTIMVWGNRPHYVYISYWPSGAGGFGHIGIAVDTKDTQGFSTFDPKMSPMRRIFGSPPARVEDDADMHRVMGTNRVKNHRLIPKRITTDQARAMKIAIRQRFVNPGRYNLLVNNCAQFVEEVLHAGKVRGVAHGEILIPFVLAPELRMFSPSDARSAMGGPK